MFKETMPSQEELKKRAEQAEKAKGQTEKGMEHLAKLPEEKLEEIKKKYKFEASEKEKKKAAKKRKFWEKKKEGE